MEYISYTPFKNVLQHQIKKINFVVLISFYTISLVHTGTYGIRCRYTAIQKLERIQCFYSIIITV